MRSTGVSACRTTSGKTSATSAGETVISSCWAPSSATIFCWWTPSSNSASVNLIEKVCSGASVYLAITAAVIEESMPPER